MTGMLRHRISLVWAALVVATLLSIQAGHGLQLAHRLGFAVTWLLIVTFGKAWLVIWEFMEVRHAPLPLRIALSAWAVGICILLIHLA